MIAEKWFGLNVVDADPNSHPFASADPALNQGRFYVTVEDRSTNCGANASESRKVLETCGIQSPRSIIVVQDPTMCRRTVATFHKVYADLGDNAPQVASWPTFVPEVSVKDNGKGREIYGDLLGLLEFSSSGPTGLRRDGLWDMRRFVDLVVGEIPRLRDDSAGYGPRGRGFIAHVDVPSQAEEAWKTIGSALEGVGREH